MIDLLYGPIASGKSTYARECASDHAIVVNDDAIVTSLHGGDYKLYADSLKPLYKGLQVAIASSAVLMGLDVVIDMPMQKKSTRDRWRMLGESWDVEVNLVMFKDGLFSEDDGVRRFHHDPRGLTMEAWQEVARRHKNQHDPVSLEEMKLYAQTFRRQWIA